MPARTPEAAARENIDAALARSGWLVQDFDMLDLSAERDKVSLDIFWLKDESLEHSANLPAPEITAAEIADDLRAALEQFEAIQTDLAKPRAGL